MDVRIRNFIINILITMLASFLILGLLSFVLPTKAYSDCKNCNSPNKREPKGKITPNTVCECIFYRYCEKCMRSPDGINTWHRCTSIREWCTNGNQFWGGYCQYCGEPCLDIHIPC